MPRFPTSHISQTGPGRSAAGRAPQTRRCRGRMPRIGPRGAGRSDRLGRVVAKRSRSSLRSDVGAVPAGDPHVFL